MIIPMPVVYVFLVIFNTCTYVACLHKLIMYGNYKNNKKQSLFFFLLIVKLKKKIEISYDTSEPIKNGLLSEILEIVFHILNEI